MKVRVLFSYVFWDYVIVCSFYHKMDNDTSSYFDFDFDSVEVLAVNHLVLTFGTVLHFVEFAISINWWRNNWSRISKWRVCQINLLWRWFFITFSFFIHAAVAHWWRCIFKQQQQTWQSKTKEDTFLFQFD